MSTETTYKMKAFELAGVALKHAAWVHDYDQGATGEEGKQLFAKHKPVISEKEIEDIVVRTQQRCAAAGIPQDKMDKIVAALRSNAQAPNATIETVQKQAEAEVAFAIAEVAKERAEQAAEISNSQAWGRIGKLQKEINKATENAHNKGYIGDKEYEESQKKQKEIDALRAQMEAEKDPEKKAQLEKQLADLTVQKAQDDKAMHEKVAKVAHKAGDHTTGKESDDAAKKAEEARKHAEAVKEKLDHDRSARLEIKNQLKEELVSSKEGYEKEAPKNQQDSKHAEQSKKADNAIKDISPDELGDLMGLAAAQNNKAPKAKGLS